MSLHPVDRRRPAVFFTWKRFGIYVYIHYIRICVSRSVSIHRFFRHVCVYINISSYRPLNDEFDDPIQVAFIYPFEVSSFDCLYKKLYVSYDHPSFFFIYTSSLKLWKVNINTCTRKLRESSYVKEGVKETMIAIA